MGDYPGFVKGPVVGVASCAKCDSIGTIVDMGLCCKVQRWKALGAMWDVPAGDRPKRRTCKRPGRRHG